MCKDDNPDCKHLFQGNGAADTIVRLPDSVRFFVVGGSAGRTYFFYSQCGPMPFARVARHQILQSNLSSRANAALIHELALDTNFSAITPSQYVLAHLFQEPLN